MQREFKPGDRVRIKPDHFALVSDPGRYVGEEEDRRRALHKNSVLTIKAVEEDMLTFVEGIGGWYANRFELVGTRGFKNQGRGQHGRSSPDEGTRKFKPGDKARVLKEISILGYKGGEVVTVQEVEDDRVFITGKYPNGETPSMGLYEHKLGPVPKRDYVADHARRTLRKAGLSAEEARKVVQYWDHPNYALSMLSRKLPTLLSILLLEAFTWEDTAEGSAYWSNIQEREYEKERNAQAQ